MCWPPATRTGRDDQWLSPEAAQECQQDPGCPRYVSGCYVCESAPSLCSGHIIGMKQEFLLFLFPSHPCKSPSSPTFWLIFIISWVGIVWHHLCSCLFPLAFGISQEHQAEQKPSVHPVIHNSDTPKVLLVKSPLKLPIFQFMDITKAELMLGPG